MNNKKGFLHMAIGVVIVVVAIGAVVSAGFTYVAYQDIKNQLKCGRYDCSQQTMAVVPTVAVSGNSGNLAGGIQNGG